jgi:hypothetical protein
MASSINTANINGEYPVAGQDNSSQGFRDNFTNIKTNFNYTKSEIEDLQDKVLLKEGLTGTTLDNNMDGNLIYNVELNRVSMSKNAIGVTSGTVTLDFEDGYYQTLITGGAITLGFTGWPSSGTYGEMVVLINVANVAHTVELPAAVTKGLDTVPGIDSSTITFPAAGEYVLKFITDDNGSTIRVEYANAPGVAGAVYQRTVAAAIGQAGDTTGMVAVDADYIYVCTADYDGSTAIWKRTAISTW